MLDYRVHAATRASLALLALSLGWGPAPSAAAEGLAGKAPAGACAAVPSGVSSTRAEEIQTLYAQFECHFSRAEYEQSLPYLERACRLTSSPRCLLNLGAVHHALLHCDTARDYYEQFLHQAPYDEEQSDAQRALQEIRAACPGRQAEVRAEEPAPPPPADAILPLGSLRVAPEGVLAASAPGESGKPAAASVKSELDGGAHSASTRRTLAWSLLGAGGAAAFATAIAAGYGMRAEADFDTRNRRDGGRGLADDAELRAIHRRGQSYNQLMLGLGVASGLLIGTGSAIWLLELGGGDSDLAVTGGALLRYRARF